MPFQNPTNLGRVEKMIATLDLMEKSAASNKATSAEVQTVLDPLIDRIADILGIERDPGYTRGQDEHESASEAPPVSSEPSSVPTPPVIIPTYMHLRDMALQAPLKDLTGVMAIILSRIDEQIADKKLL